MSKEKSETYYLNRYRDEQGRLRSLVNRKKYCACCGRLLWKKDFYKKGHGRSAYCKECSQEKSKERYVPKRKDGVYRDSVGRLVEWKNGHWSFYWTDSMVAELKKYYPTTTNKELTTLFMMGEYSITKKAKELGLVKDKAFLKEQARQGGSYGGMKTRALYKKRRAYLSQASSFQCK